MREAVARDIDMVQIWNHDLDPAAWRAIFTDPIELHPGAVAYYVSAKR